MDNKKFEQLIDLIINENEEQARALFHDIVVEKSREIYESIMDEEFGGQDQVGGLVDEISAEEEGMTEEEDEFADIGDEEGDEEVALDSDDIGGEETGEEDLEDRVVDLEDKLDELMAEFESIMAGEEGGDMGGEENFGGEEGGEEGFGGDEMMEGEEEDLEESSEEEEEETLEEAVQLQKVSVTHGDNGQNTKSIVSSGPKVGGNGASAANLNKGFQDSGKGGTQGGLLNPATKDLPGAGKFKNAPKAKVDLESAPKAKHGDNGQNTKSIVGESKKTVKKIVK
jgi:hypothetical protein